MDQIEQHLDKLGRQLDQRISQVSSRSSRLTLFTLAIVLVVLILLIVFGNRYISKIDDRLNILEAAVTTSNNLRGQNQQSQPATPEAVSSLSARLTALETLQEAMTSTSRSALEQMNFIFTIVAAFFGLFSVFFAYRQIMSDNSREGHDTEMRNLVSSFQNNINTISSLIITLEKGYEFRGDIQKQLSSINERAASLEVYRTESDKVFDRLIAYLNSEAIELFDPDVDRATLSLEESARRLASFTDKMNGAATTREIENILNPFCYYLRGLSNVAIYQYELANKDFDIAQRKGKADLANPKMTTYAEHHRENVIKTIRDMLVICCYFQGISYKNLGEYAESRTKFQEALDREPTHLQSKTYMLQIMFFDTDVQFEAIEKEYEKTIEEFKSLERSGNFERDKIKRAFNVLKINQGNMYLKKAIPLDFRTGYKQFEDQSKALKYYWEAFDYLENDLAAFSVAQAMEGVGRSDWRGKTPDDLYRKAMSSLKRRIAEDHDQLYSVMLYYMLSICARKLEQGNETSEVFLSQARHSLRQVPGHITCFSPINKIRLSRNQVLEEMERFEKIF